MKEMKYIIGIIVITLLSACSEEEWLKNNNQDEIIVEAGFANTRTTFVEDDGTTHVSWERGDEIGLFTDEQLNLRYAAQDEGNTTKFSSLSEKIAATEGDKVYAYYPYNIDNNGLKVQLPDIVVQNFQNYDFIYAIGTLTKNKVTLQFNHILAFLKITLPLELIPDRDERSGLTVLSSNEIGFSGGEAYFDLEKEEIVCDEKRNEIWYSIPTDDKLKDKQKITCYIAILPQEEDSEISILFSKDGSTKNSDRLLTKKVPTGGFKAGNVYTLYINENESEVIEQKERDALIALYNATNGDNWVNNENWCSDKPLDEWYGVYTNINGVYQLSLTANQLNGIIPEEIINLESLRELYIDENQINKLPENIGKLTNLEHLIISNNQISQLPQSIEDLVNLRMLLAQHVGLNGTLPNFSKLTSLEEIALDYNALSGEIPESIGRVQKLKHLSLSNNNLSGYIPKEIENLSMLNWLSLGNNNLNGEIPSSIEDLSNLTCLSLEKNHLSGEIPKDISKLQQLKLLYLNDNNLSGEIPNNLKHLKQLEVFSIGNNNIGGSIPADFAELPLLTSLNLQNNRLSGAIPEKLYLCSQWNNWNPAELIFKQQKGYVLYLENYYESTDFSKDGEILILQKHKLGNGIKIVLMGDLFIDKDMDTGGFYESVMKEATENYFSIEPYHSLRDYFDVICIKAVSKHNWITGETAFKATNEDGDYIDSNKCEEYARKALNSTNLDNVQVILIRNVGISSGGQSTSPTPGKLDTFTSCNYSIDEPVGFKNTIIHESGHGFAGLRDEYILYETRFTAFESLDYEHGFGSSANVDYKSDPSKVYWAHFISDPRYENENIGVYEGASLNRYGIYRPTEYSIMREFDNGVPVIDQFNAPSREAIYKRAMKLAYGDSWTYDYEEFVKFDEQGHIDFVNALNNAKTRSSSNSTSQKYKHNPPVIYDYPAVVK